LPSRGSSEVRKKPLKGKRVPGRGAKKPRTFWPVPPSTLCPPLALLLLVSPPLLSWKTNSVCRRAGGLLPPGVRGRIPQRHANVAVSGGA